MGAAFYMAGRKKSWRNIKKGWESMMKEQVELWKDELHPSENNVFSIELDEAMEELIASIKSQGILTPLVVRRRKVEEGYEILSGHRRYVAATMAGLERLPCIIVDVTDEDAAIIIADSNLQRPYIKLSEKAWSIRMKYDAIKRKSNGERLGEPGASNELDGKDLTKGKSADIIAGQMGMSSRTIKNYVRLTYLIEDLLVMIDEGQIPMKAGVQLSYLSEKNQDYVASIISTEGIRLNEEKALYLKRELGAEANINDVLFLLKPDLLAENRKPSKPVLKIRKDVRVQYFPKKMTDAQIEEVLIALTQKWAEQNNPEYAGYQGR